MRVNINNMMYHSFGGGHRKCMIDPVDAILQYLIPLIEAIGNAWLNLVMTCNPGVEKALGS